MKRIFQCFGCKGSPCTLTLNNTCASTRVPKKCMYELAAVNWKEKTPDNEAIKDKRKSQKEAIGVLEEHRRSILPREGVDKLPEGFTWSMDKIPGVSGSADKYPKLPTTGGLPVGTLHTSPDGTRFVYCAFGNPDPLSQ